MKDPAALIYIDKYYSGTSGMSADFRGWYFDLIMYQYDKGGIPNNEDDIYSICRTKPSEFERFKLFLKQVLKQKYKLIDGKYINETAEELITKRKNFKDKRTKSGTVGYLIKLFNGFDFAKKMDIEKVKAFLYNLDTKELNQAKDKQMLKQMLKQKRELYINVDVNEDINKDKTENENFEGFKIQELTETQKQAGLLLQELNESAGVEYPPNNLLHRKHVESALEFHDFEILTKVIHHRVDLSNKGKIKRSWLAPQTLFNLEKIDKYVQEVKDIETGISTTEESSTVARRKERVKKYAELGIK